MREYVTVDGRALTDADLEEEAETFERGERPPSWREPEAQAVSVRLPAWVIASADAEARRVNVSRRAILNMWLAEAAERSDSRRRSAAMA